MNLMFWKKKEPREDRLERLAREIRNMTDEEVRRFIKRARPGMHISINPRHIKKEA